MFDLLKKESKALYSFCKRNYREMVVMGLATLFLTLAQYHSIGPEWIDSLVYYAVLPILTIVVILRRNPLDFGFKFGNYRIWGFHVGLTVIIGLPILYVASRSSLLAEYYVMGELDLPMYSLKTLVILFSWEFLFRGFLLFGLKDKLGEISILVQMIPFVLLHFGKPEIETISTILMGIYFGYVVYRGKSYWPALITHLFIDISFRIFVNLL